MGSVLAFFKTKCKEILVGSFIINIKIIDKIQKYAKMDGVKEKK